MIFLIRRSLLKCNTRYKSDKSLKSWINNIDNNLIIELWDMLGNKVLEKEFNDDQVSFSTKNMTKGVYLVKIKQENQELYTQKILLID